MLSAAAFVACLCLWTPAPAEGQVNPPRRFGIEGRVVAGAHRDAVQGASVTLEDIRGATRRTQITDSSGLFAFYSIQRGSYTIRVQHANFQELALAVEMMDEQEMQRLEIPLTPRPESPRSAPPQGVVPAWALQIPEKASREYTQALKSFREGKYRASIPRLETAVSIYPGFAAAFATLGAARQSLGEISQAVSAYRQALEIDGDQVAACLGLGSILRAQDHSTEAEPLLLRAHALRGDDWRVNLELAELYFATDAIEKAEPFLRRARELHSASPRVFLLLINVLALQEKFPEALAAMDDYLQHFPKDSFAAQVRKKRDSLQEHLRSARAGRR